MVKTYSELEHQYKEILSMQARYMKQNKASSYEELFNSNIDAVGDINVSAHQFLEDSKGWIVGEVRKTADQIIQMSKMREIMTKLSAVIETAVNKLG